MVVLFKTTDELLQKEKEIRDLLVQEDLKVVEPFSFQKLSQKISFIHSCGHITTINIRYLLKGSRCNNPICVSERRAKTNISKYGSQSCFGNKDVQNKIKKTIQEKYGCDYPMQNKEIKDKSNETCIEKYAYKNCLLNEKVKDKCKQTLLNKYGVENALLNADIQNKRKNTIKEKYGFDHHFKHPDIIEKRKNTWIEKYGTEIAVNNSEIRKKIYTSRLTNSYNNIISKFEETLKIKPLFSFNDYKGIKNSSYDFQCLVCNTIFSYNLGGTNHFPVCRQCNPITRRKLETEFQDFISSLIQIERNKYFSYNDGRNRYELDVFVPSLNIGFEFDGIYWHSEYSGGKDRNYHINKNNFFLSQGIQVYRIWENEWLFKQDIVKSIIKNKLNINSNSLYARNLKIIELSSKQKSDFFEQNHIQGDTISSFNIGLIDKLNDIKCAISISKSRFNKNYEYELTRFANKLDHNVVGGFSRLLKYFEKTYHPKNIISYADKRYSNGNLYLKNNFILKNISKPNYYYIKDHFELENRIKYQKHKLKHLLNDYKEEFTEWENMLMNGFDRIWDLGNFVFIKEF